MRIAILTNRFPPLLDGVGDYSCQLANELQRQGHTVTVLCRREAAIEEAVQREKFSVTVFSTVPAWDWRAIRPLLAFIRQHRPDWLLVQYVPNSFQHWAMPVWLPILIWLTQRQSIQVGITFHEVSIRRQIWPLKYGLVSLIQRLIAWLLARLSNEVVTSINQYAEQLQAYTSKPVHLIPIGSNIRPIVVTATETASIKQQVAANSGPIVSTFGIRNHDLLFQVMEYLLQDVPSVNILVIGNLSVTEAVQPCYRLCRHRVHVTGYLSEADVYRYLMASDVFFIPDSVTSNGEGGSSNKSTSLAAGLAAGLPVVGIRGDMNNDLLHSTPGLFLEDATDPAAIAARLHSLLAYNSQTEALHFFEQHLSWKAIVRHYTEACSWARPE